MFDMCHVCIYDKHCLIISAMKNYCANIVFPFPCIYCKINIIILVTAMR